MPTYQYACTECAHAFEQVQAFTDDALTECPQCQGRLRKLFNAVGVVFKGSGFYRNDSRKPESTGAPSSASSSASSSGSSSGSASGGEKKSEPAKSETTSAKKTESKPAQAASA